MQKTIIVGAVLLAIGGAVTAQEQPSGTQALINKLLNEVNANIQCNAAAIDLQRALGKAQAEVKRLTDKYAKAPEDGTKDEPKAEEKSPETKP